MNWKALFRSPGGEPAEFAGQFIAMVEERLPGARTAQAGPLAVEITLTDGQLVRADLSHAWAECRRAPASRGEILERLAGSLADLERSPEIQPQSIVPLIRDRAFMEQALRNAPGGAAGVKAEHLVADLWIAYAQDTPTSWKYVPDDFPLSLAELRETAIKNLRALLPGIQRRGEGPCYMLTAGEQLTASVLLLDEIWNEEAWSVEGELVAAAPTRHVVLFTGSDSAAGLAKLQDTARYARTTGPDPLSTALLVRRHGQWEEYPGSAS